MLFENLGLGWGGFDHYSPKAVLAESYIRWLFKSFSHEFHLLEWEYYFIVHIQLSKMLPKLLTAQVLWINETT